MSIAIDAYLDAVDLELLKSGASRPHRQGIIKDLEAHIQEMLRERVGGSDRQPSEADIAAVLASLGAPAAYAGTNGGGAGGAERVITERERVRRVLPSQAKWGIALSIVGWFGVLTLMIAAGNLMGRRRGSESEFLLIMIAGAPVVLMIVLSTVLGWWTWRQVSREPERYWGRPLAALEMGSFPFLMLLASPLLFVAIIFGAIFAFALHRVYDLKRAVPRMFAST